MASRDSIRSGAARRAAQERIEFLEAKLRYDLCRDQIRRLEPELAELKAQVPAVAGAEQAYERALAEATAWTLQHGGVHRDELAAQVERESALAALAQELREAVHAGEDAELLLSRARNGLDNSLSWGRFDLFGGKVVTSLLKHDRLDEAYGFLRQAQRALARYHAELADVRQSGRIELDVPNAGGRLVDAFLDHLLVDYLKQHEIQGARQRVDDALLPLRLQLEVLRERLAAAQADLARAQSERAAWIAQLA